MSMNKNLTYGVLETKSKYELIQIIKEMRILALELDSRLDAYVDYSTLEILTNDKRTTKGFFLRDLLDITRGKTK